MNKLETRSMLNPKCQECSKKDTCNNKTLCAYLIPKKISKDTNLEQLSVPAQVPLKLTTEMIQKEIEKQIINKQFEIGIDFGVVESKSSCIIESRR